MTFNQAAKISSLPKKKRIEPGSWQNRRSYIVHMPLSDFCSKIKDQEQQEIVTPVATGIQNDI